MTKQLSELLTDFPHKIDAFSFNPPISGITADSRRVKPGFLFVAYRGVQVDGHRFIPDALARGAAAIIAEHDFPADVPSTVPIICVPDGREALAHAAAAWHNHPSRRMTVIGVTGTDGKTSTTNLIFHILRHAGKKVGMISTVNAVIGDTVLETGLHTTTPDAPEIQQYLAEMASVGTEFCVLETTSHGLAQHRVSAVDFDWAVVTNITHEHLDLHGSLSAYRQAKAKLFGMAKIGAVLNADDSSIAYLPDWVRADAKIVRYGASATADVRATDVSFRPDATLFRTKLRGEPVQIKTPLVGAFNVSNVLAALATTVEGAEIEPSLALTALESFGGVSGRMERIDAGQSFTAIVDFAHTPNALRRALETARTLTDGRVIAVFGSAGLRDVAKRQLMAEVAAELADITILTAEDPRTETLSEILETMASAMVARGAVELHAPEEFAATSRPVFFRKPDRGRAIFLATQLARSGDIVIALGKGHEQSMCFGDTEYPWDDREAMRSALRGMPLLTLPTGK